MATSINDATNKPSSNKKDQIQSKIPIKVQRLPRPNSSHHLLSLIRSNHPSFLAVIMENNNLFKFSNKNRHNFQVLNSLGNMGFLILAILGQTIKARTTITQNLSSPSTRSQRSSMLMAINKLKSNYKSQT